MEFIKKNAVAITGLLISLFFVIRGYKNSSSEAAEAMPLFVSLSIVILAMLVLIYFKHYRKSR